MRETPHPTLALYYRVKTHLPDYCRKHNLALLAAV